MDVGDAGMSVTTQIVSKKEPKKLDLKPMDPAKVEEVVKKYAEKHIRHKHGAVIFIGCP